MKVTFSVIVPLSVALILYSCSTPFDSSGGMSGDGAYSLEGDDAGAGGEVSGQNGSEISKPGQLTAGEWNDLINWNFWRSLFLQQDIGWREFEEKWGVHTNGRYIVKVEFSNNPANDLSVRLDRHNGDCLYRAKTDISGCAPLFANTPADDTDSLVVTVSIDGNEIDRKTISSAITDTVRFSFPEISSPEVNNIDILFLIDATGSMSDELEYLKTEIADVVERVKTFSSNAVLRLSVNFYRDAGDEFVVRSFPFTDDISAVQRQINAQHANGGGDYPEAVHLSLDDAITRHEWSLAACARLLFMVLDAPPHYDQQIPSLCTALVHRAAENGIKIIPVASSGIDKETEFLLRSFSILTNGTYIFLTNHSGIGNDHLEPTIGQYTIEYLNDLLVRVIQQYSKR